MPATSQSQQRLFGMVRECQETGHCVSSKVRAMASRVSEQDVHDFAATSRRGLPRRKKKMRKSTPELLRQGVALNIVIGAALEQARRLR